MACGRASVIVKFQVKPLDLGATGCPATGMVDRKNVGPPRRVLGRIQRAGKRKKHTTLSVIPKLGNCKTSGGSVSLSMTDRCLRGV